VTGEKSMKNEKLVNRVLIVLIIALTAAAVRMMLRISRLEKQEKWLAQRVALLNEKTRH
jgi:hypothetical protein